MGVQSKWDRKWFADEPKQAEFEHGTVSFAGAGPNSRSCHIFIAFDPNGRSLGRAPHETPLGKVTRGIEVLSKIQHNFVQSGYPDLTELQGEIIHRGNEAAANYDKLDRIRTCQVVEDEL